MKILVACEFSGRVREAFRARGHEAFSFDLLPSDIPSPFHIQEDVRPFLATGEWDMLVGFPPCTHLAVSGARYFAQKRQLQAEALEFVWQLMSAPIPRIAIENPIGVISSHIRKPDQIVQPWQFGHGEVKSTCLWLKNLPKLQPTNIVEGRKPAILMMPDTKDQAKKRSLTYQGIADAMASQWGNE